MPPENEKQFAGGLPVIGATMGDSGGMGTEIVLKALSDPLIRHKAKFVVFGMDEQLWYAADMI